MGSNGQRRVINTDITPEDQKIESSLRPQMLKDYIGQEKIKSNLKVYIDAAKSRGNLWIMCCFTGLRDWARPPCPALLPMKWA